MTAAYRVRPGQPLRGTVRVPGDKSIGHRALLLAGLAEGRSVITGLSGGLDNRATAQMLRDLGVTIVEAGDRAEVNGVGLRGLRQPLGDLDCCNSGTSMRLFAGLLSAMPFGCRLIGDRSLARRPMARIVEPLRRRGAHIDGTHRDEQIFPPLRVAPLLPTERLTGIAYDMPVASAQVKSALLLSGLYADGPTALKEPTISRDHTERMLLALGVPLTTQGSMVVLNPDGWRGGWDGFEWNVPGDFSSAAFLLAAAEMVEGSALSIEGTGMNPTRTGFFDAMRLMGSNAAVSWKGEDAGGEPLGTLTVTCGALRGTLLGGELVTRMIDEVPALCALAARSRGTTEIRDARELRVKESDRIAAMGMVLRAFGVSCRECEDGLIIEGGSPLRGATVESLGDHRIAMAATLLGLAASGETIVRDVACVDTSFPGFLELFEGLGADVARVDA